MSGIDDLDMDMEEIVQDVTEHTIKYINSTLELYNAIKYSSDPIDKICVAWAEAHNNEFGELFQTELDMVDWAEVRRRI